MKVSKRDHEFRSDKGASGSDGKKGLAPGGESTDNLEDGILVRYSPLLKLAGYTGRQVLQTLNG
jgi:hypothetical protein